MSRGGQVWAVVLAAGSGRRAGRAKQFARIGGRTLLARACAPFLQGPAVEGLVVVTPAGHPERIEEVERELRAGMDGVELRIVQGGATRHLSAQAGLDALGPSCELVLIHDAARPFTSATLVDRVVAAAAESGAAVPVVGLKDAILEVDDSPAPGDDGRNGRGQDVRRYLPRQSLRAVQTPQGFSLELLRRAFREAGRPDAPDEGSVVLESGRPVSLVEGEPDNLKITSAGELEWALRRLREES